jgi:hypothetical protein
MNRFEDNLWESVVEQHGDDLARVDARPGTTRPRRRSPRRRVLAGGTLGLAGIGAAMVIALGGSTAPPAYAITTSPDGSVLVTFNYEPATNFWQLEHKLIGEYHEMVAAEISPGPATLPGPVTCTPMKDADPGMPNTSIKIELGQDGTATIPAGDTGAIPGIDGSGPVHLSACQLFIEKPTDNGGNTGGDTPGVFGFNPNGTSAVANSRR